MTERAIAPPDFEVMRATIMEAGRDALNPDAENRRPLFERAVRDVRGIRADTVKWANYSKHNPEVRRKADELRQWAERRIGQFLRAMKAAGILTDGRAKKGKKIGAHTPTDALTLKDLGIDRRESHQWQRFAKLRNSSLRLFLLTRRQGGQLLVLDHHRASKSTVSRCPASPFPIGSGRFDQMPLMRWPNLCVIKD